jgi:hypothetical protein
VAGAAAAAVVVLAGVLVADRVTSKPPLPPVNQLVSEPAPAPRGTKLVRWRGVEVAVPERLFEGEFHCGLPQTSAVLVNSIPDNGDCVSYIPPGVDLVWITTPRAYYFKDLPHGDPVTVSGVAARHVVGTAYDGRYTEAIAVPSHDTLIVVMPGKDRAFAKRVLDSVRVSEGTDTAGCPLRAESLTAVRPPVREGADQAMVPGTPVQASVCRYGRTYWVSVSKLLGARATARLAARLNALSPGWSPPSGYYQSRYPYVVTFRYERGLDLTVWVNMFGAEEVGASNGTAVGALDDALIKVLRPLGGWTYTYEAEEFDYNGG